MTKPFERDYYHDFDLFDPELNGRWDELIPHLHAGCPVARSEVGEGYWVVNRYEDVTRCAKEWATFSAADGFMVNRPAGLPYFAPGECDPPLHDKLRAALGPFLRPKVVAQLEERIRGHVHALIDRFIATGAAEIVSGFANPLPQAVFSLEVAGMDEVDMPFLMEVFSLSCPMEQRAANFALGMARIEAYLAQRRDAPARADMVDALLAFEYPGYTWMDKVGTRPINRHLAFGAGNHSCIGASLARLILEIGFREFLTRIPDFSVPVGFVPNYETGNTRHMVELPLRFAAPR